MNAFSDALKKLRSKIGSLNDENSITQDDLAQNLGFHRQFLSSLETGVRPPSLKVLSKIVKHYLKVEHTVDGSINIEDILHLISSALNVPELMTVTKHLPKPWHFEEQIIKDSRLVYIFTDSAWELLSKPTMLSLAATSLKQGVTWHYFVPHSDDWDTISHELTNQFGVVLDQVNLQAFSCYDQPLCYMRVAVYEHSSYPHRLRGTTAVGGYEHIRLVELYEPPVVFVGTKTKRALTHFRAKENQGLGRMNMLFSSPSMSRTI